MSAEDFKRSQEERDAEAARVREAIERMRAEDERRGGPPPKARQSEPTHIDIHGFLASVAERATAADEERKSLPCYPHGEDDAAARACEEAKAFESCRWKALADVCPRTRMADDYDAVVRHLSAPEVRVRVPEWESQVILAAARPGDRVPLERVDTLVATRCLLARKRIETRLEHARQIFKTAAGKVEYRSNALSLTGMECLAFFGGNQGRGKTLSACYAIARRGGLYTRAPQWTRRNGIDVDAAIAAPVLVIDQFGREHWGDSQWALSQLEDAIDTRFQAMRLTFLVGNLSWETFAKRLKDTTIVDRLFSERALFIEFGGESMRAQLRDKALAGGKG